MEELESPWDVHDVRKKLDEDDHSDSPSFRLRRACVRMTTSCLCGVVYGFVLEKGRVFEPEVLRDQMTLSRFVLLKTFVFACAMSMFSFSILTIIPQTQNYMSFVMHAHNIRLLDKGIASSIMGGCILGAGMTLSGSSPGLALAQVGAKVDGSMITVFGCLFGALVYGMVQSCLTLKYTNASATATMTNNLRHQYASSPYFMQVLPWASILGVAGIAMELLSPWSAEVPSELNEGRVISTTSYWPPYLTGIIIGLIQILPVLVNYDYIAIAHSYCTIIAQIPLFRHHRYFLRFRKGLSNWWQVSHACGLVAGAFLSASVSKTTDSVMGVAPFWGGVLMLFGSCLAGGCDSDHGIFGIALMTPQSIITVVAMFASGTFTAITLSWIS